VLDLPAEAAGRRERLTDQCDQVGMRSKILQRGPSSPLLGPTSVPLWLVSKRRPAMTMKTWATGEAVA